MRNKQIPLVSIQGDSIVFHADGVQAFSNETMHAITQELKNYEPMPRRKRVPAVHVAPIGHECEDMPKESSEDKPE